jgi:N-methylhydantoinase A/oxoprolinase/acetone carboxylase beta subunit
VSVRLGSDTGGTFTDLVTEDGTIAKVPSTRDDPGEAVRIGVAALTDATPSVLAHGTTVATNALLERRGARVGLVTTAGFRDVIEIARQDRPSLYDQTVDRPEPLVPRRWRYEVIERLDATGSELTPLDPGSLPEIDEAVEALAVCLLHSDLDSTHEQALGDWLRARGYDVSVSCEVSPEFREYERTVTVVVNAYLRPICRAYLHALRDVAGDVVVMTSAGGLVPADEGAERPAALLLSGPAGGVSAAAAVAAANGWPDAISFDMGGTSTDVCLILDGRPAPAAERDVAGLPVRMPALDVHTIGAGGGSIARVDDGGALVVGPASAGAVPGPACYGRGGEAPTVTDANLVVGHISSGIAFPGLGVLDRGAAERAFARAGVDPDGVLRVVNANMEQALRVVSVERGVDPRDLALVAFGGAGPLHACALADALDMACVIVPARAGVLSAVGILASARRADRVWSWATPSDHTGVDAALVALGEEARAALGEPVETLELALDCRYAGQSHELTVPSVASFAAEHERRNGYARDGHPVEVVALRAAAIGRAPRAVTDLPVVVREEAVGPYVISEDDCTIWVPHGWRAETGETGALVLRRARDVKDTS